MLYFIKLIFNHQWVVSLIFAGEGPNLKKNENRNYFDVIALQEISEIMKNVEFSK
jgi:hypothetical protein